MLVISLLILADTYNLCTFKLSCFHVFVSGSVRFSLFDPLVCLVTHGHIQNLT